MSTLSLSSPTMSDKTLLVSVEDLICIAMGPREGNTVNFKMIQTILHILARQMRVLEQKVVVVAGELPEKRLPSRDRGRQREKGDKVEEVYRRPNPPEFKTEEDRIAWEREQDELERRAGSESRRRSRADSRVSRHVDADTDTAGAGRGRRRTGDADGDDRLDGREGGARGTPSRDDELAGRGGAGARRGEGARHEAGGRGRAGDDDSGGSRSGSGGRAGAGAGGTRDDVAGGRGGGGREGAGGARGGRGGEGSGGEEGREGAGGARGAEGGGSEGEGGGGRTGRGRDGDAIEGAGGGPGGRGGRDDAERGGRRGIGVREVEGPGKEKVLIDSIAVVTQSQFQLLEEQVEQLMRAAGPLPALTMPDNQQLRQELAAGASLTDAMQAMQVSARVQAAEQAITKLTGLLTQLAASGALPPEAAGAVLGGGWTDDDEALIKSPSSRTEYKSIRIDPSAKDVRGHQDHQASKASGAQSATSKESVLAAKFVTKPEMGTALTKLREEVTRALQGQIDKASTTADAAEKTAKTVGEKVEELLKMDNRLSAMHSMVEDYTEQLNGFDAGLNTQMTSFKEQMSTMRAELQGGLEQLESSNSNPETAAVMELNERFEALVRGLDDTLLQHAALSNMQHQLTQELKTLVEGVEMLREQKADRDELLDILRDKADISMLEGLVRQEEFDKAQADLERRLQQCNDKFKRQDDVWMEAIRDLRELADTKAQLTELLKIRDEATAQLRSIDERINRLALILGEPKAAMLMRKLARDAVCGACLTPALMHPGGEPAPPALPAARGPAVPAPCPPEPRVPDYPDFRTHRCHRWVGGSHTLLPPARAHAAPIDLPDVTRKFVDYGEDGRLYWMETAMEACVECNMEPAPASAPAPPGTARSDAAPAAPPATPPGAGGDAKGAAGRDVAPRDSCACL